MLPSMLQKSTILSIFGPSPAPRIYFNFEGSSILKERALPPAAYACDTDYFVSSAILIIIISLNNRLSSHGVLGFWGFGYVGPS